MYYENNRLLYSPSDLIVFFESEFASWMERLSVEQPNVLQERDEEDALKLEAKVGMDLAYLNEVLFYEENGKCKSKPSMYETDILIIEKHNDTSYKPRVVIEAKINNVTTHDAIVE